MLAGMNDDVVSRATRRPYDCDSDGEARSLRIDSLVAKNTTPKFTYVVAFIASFGAFLIGYDIGVISAVLLFVREEFALSVVWQEAVVASVAATAALFAGASVIIDERVGSKVLLLCASVMCSVGAVCMAVSTEKYVLVTARLILGAGFGLLSTGAPIYLDDCVTSSMKHQLVPIQTILSSLGILTANVIAGFLASNENEGWRYMLGLAAVPAVVHFSGLCFLPESPRCLVSAGKDLDARLSLQRLRGYCDIDDEFDGIKTSCANRRRLLNQDEGDSKVLSRIWKSSCARRALLVGCSLHLLKQFSGINAILYYSAVVVKMAGVRTNSLAIWLSVVTAFVHSLATLGGVVMIEKIGRRVLTLASLVGIIVCLSWTAVGFQFTTVDSPIVTFRHKDLKNTSCYAARTCYECVRQPSCGFCDSSSPISGGYNSSCVTSDRQNQRRTKDARCPTNGGNFSGWSYDACPTSYTWIPLLGILFSVGVFAPGLGMTPWSINREIHSSWASRCGNAASIVVDWIGSLIVSSSFLSLSQALTTHGMLGLYGGVCVFGLIGLSVILPETKDRTTEDIDNLFIQPWCGASSNVDNTAKTIQYVHIRGLNRDGAMSELDSPD